MPQQDSGLQLESEESKSQLPWEEKTEAPVKFESLLGKRRRNYVDLEPEFDCNDGRRLARLEHMAEYRPRRRDVKLYDLA